MNEIALSATESETGTAGALRRVDTAQFPAQARWVLKLLERAEHAGQGTLDLTFPDGQRARYGRGEPAATVRLADWSVFAAALKRGDIGFAETYADGGWSSPDCARLLRFFIGRRTAMEKVIYGSALGGLVYRIKHLCNRNSRAGAKKNIAAHYDLGNAFYALWLDLTMTYSSALFAPAQIGPDTPAAIDEAAFAQAQQAKYRRVLDELALAPGGRLLEIGCGWGGLAETAARAGLAVTGLTLSPSQLAYARARIKRYAKETASRPAVDLRLQDYREIAGQYDGVASIEMFEAVGAQYWPVYFARLRRALAPGARACIQTIEIRDDLFERYRRGTDFIQQYIFPGGMLPCPRVFEQHARRAGLAVVNAFSFGRHYAHTLALWRARFMRRAAAVRALGFDERFIRLWEFYLAYCEAAFAEGNTDVTQYTLACA